jgi:hypothetical protein
METNTEFDLNEALARWRQSIALSPSITSGNARELEAHLNDSIASLQKAGLSPAESFQIAAQRIGSVETLAAEFGKINLKSLWLDRAFWIAAALQLSIFTGYLSQFLLNLIQAIYRRTLPFASTQSFEFNYSLALFGNAFHWVLFGALVWLAWRLQSAGRLDWTRWMRLSKRYPWRFGFSLILATLLLPICSSAVFAWSQPHNLQHFSLGARDWKIILSMLSSPLIVTLALIGILRELSKSTSEKPSPRETS